MFFVYILVNKMRTKTYTGLTNNLNRRLKEHLRKKDRCSRLLGDFDVLKVEEFDSRKEAYQRERFYKSTSGRRLIRTYYKQLK